MRRICIVGKSLVGKSLTKTRLLSTSAKSNEISQLRSIVAVQDKRISKLTYDLEQSQNLTNEIPNIDKRINNITMMIDEKIHDLNSRMYERDLIIDEDFKNRIIEIKKLIERTNSINVREEQNFAMLCSHIGRLDRELNGLNSRHRTLQSLIDIKFDKLDKINATKSNKIVTRFLLVTLIGIIIFEKYQTDKIDLTLAGLTTKDDSDR